MPRFTVVVVIVVVVVTSLLTCGCTRLFTNKSIVRDAIVQLPHGGDISAEVLQSESFGHVTQRETDLIWSEPNRPRKVLVVTSGSIEGANLAGAIPEIAADGNRVRMLKDGRPVATFDYAAGTAEFAR